MELIGVLHFWSETGTEGGYWAFQNERFISPPTKDWPHPRWSYDGLYVLENSDQLTIYSKDDPNKVVWEGTVNLLQYPCFTLAVAGLWAHSEPTHILSPAQLKLKEKLIPQLAVASAELWNAEYEQYQAKTKNKKEALEPRIKKLRSAKSKLLNQLEKIGLHQREAWARWFFKGNPAKLIKAEKPQK